MARPAAVGTDRTGWHWLAPLALAQVVSWGVLYYATIVAASYIASDLAVPVALVTGLFSGGLIVSAVAGMWVGRLLDTHSPRLLMTAGSALGAMGFALVALAPNPLAFGLAWVLTGIAQAAVLYQAIFTVITRRYGPRRQGALTAITLAGGFASTIFAPVTAALLGAFGWRRAFLLLAVLLAVVTVPVHWLCLERRWPAPVPGPRDEHRQSVSGVLRLPRFWFLECSVVTITLALSTVTLAAVPLFEEKGMSFELAAVALGLIGAGQVAGRVLFLALPRSAPPWVALASVGVLATVALALLAWLPEPLWLLIVLGVLAGVARGAHTLVQASAVADRWGTWNYGAINGVFAAPVTVTAALAPAIAPPLASGIGSYATVAAVMALVALAGTLLARGS